MKAADLLDKPASEADAKRSPKVKDESTGPSVVSSISYVLVFFDLLIVVLHPLRSNTPEPKELNEAMTLSNGNTITLTYVTRKQNVRTHY